MSSGSESTKPNSPPTLTVFAGPNGSGKTSLTKKLIQLMADMGPLVNADVMAADMAGALGQTSASNEQVLEAAHAAERRRNELLEQRKSFATETVMSDRSRWLNFFMRARQAGFRVQLIFISTENPAINVGRVAQRVSSGGHDVPPEKIISRYHKTHAFLPEVLALVDQALIFDNSAPNGEPKLVLSMGPGHQFYAEQDPSEIPTWAMTLMVS